MASAIEYGVRLADGSVERVYPDAESRTVMSDEEYAVARARYLGGTLVTRTVSTTFGEWGDQR